MPLMPPGAVLCVLTVTAKDEAGVWVGVLVAVLGYFGYLCLTVIEAYMSVDLLPPACTHLALGPMPCPLSTASWTVRLLTGSVPGAWGLATFVRALVRPMHARQRLELLWRTVGGTFPLVSMFFFGADMIEAGSHGLWAHPRTPAFVVVSTLFMVNGVLAGLVIRSPGVRARIVGWLVVRGEAVMAAATVSALLGSDDLEEVQTTAQRLFRAVRMDRLTKEHMEQSSPNPALYALAEPAYLGCCDAFLSHSWSDDPEAKWAALQAWRSRFKAEHGREPSIWVDKVCIDQTDIATNLRCLPVWLAGCQRLLALQGDTYLKRLWCIIELFTFMEIRGREEDIEMRPIPGKRGTLFDFEAPAPGAPPEEVLALVHRHRDKWVAYLREFDSNEASAYLAEDRERLLATIEAGFGTLDQFNVALREVLVRVAMRMEPTEACARVMDEIDAYVQTCADGDECHSPEKRDGKGGGGSSPGAGAGMGGVIYSRHFSPNIFFHKRKRR